MCVTFITGNRGPHTMTATPFTNRPRDRFGEFNVVTRIRRRILASIAATAGWFVVVLLFLAFWASRFTLFQDIVLVVVSLIVLAAVLIGSWISFGLGFASVWDD